MCFTQRFEPARHPLVRNLTYGCNGIETAELSLKIWLANDVSVWLILHHSVTLQSHDTIDTKRNVCARTNIIQHMYNAQNFEIKITYVHDLITVTANQAILQHAT